MSSLDNGLEELQGAMFFATLDLAHGYMQVPLSEKAKEKAKFTTPDETGQF